jgi:hypothetical protein
MMERNKPSYSTQTHRTPSSAISIGRNRDVKTKRRKMAERQCHALSSIVSSLCAECAK